VLAVEELLRPVPVTRAPRSDARVAGLMNLRGKSATVVDLRACFARPTGEPALHPKMILLETADRLTDEARELGVKAFDDPVVLLVDQILGIFSVGPKDVHPRPAHVAEPFVVGVVRHAGAYVSLLDVTT
jgi:chemotaxis signal transduction protein